MKRLSLLRNVGLSLWLAGLGLPAGADVAELGVTGEVTAAVAEEFGAAAAARLAAWQDLVREAAGEPVGERLRRVNLFFNNNTGQATDAAQWQQQDYWATPLQFLARGAGDSEDSAIAKFYTLLALDVPEERLRIAYTRATLNGNTFAHMVLLFRSGPGEAPRVLDNLDNTVDRLPDRPELRVVYEFNNSGLYVPREDGERRVGDVSRLTAWTEMLARKAAGAR